MEQETQQSQESQLQSRQMEVDHNKRVISAVIISVLVTALVVGCSVYLFMDKSINQNHMDDEEVSSNNERDSQNSEDGTIYIFEENGELISLEKNNLRKIGCCYFKDDRAQKIYYIKKDILAGNRIELGHASTVDFHNFSIFENAGHYARDVTNVYASLFIPGTLDYEFKVIEGADPLTFEPKIVEQFDVSQGNTYQGSLSRDKNNVYFKYEIFEHADPESFEISNFVAINKDKNNVYLRRKILPKADPQTYEVLLDNSGPAPGAVYGKDKNNFFVDYCIVSGVDLVSVKLDYVPGKGPVFSDKGGVFTVEYNEESNTCSLVRE